MSAKTHPSPGAAPQSPPAASLQSATKNRLIYESPRCELDDSHLFSSGQELKKSDERWKYLSKQAGQHCQDGTVCRLNFERRTTPAALRLGMPRQAAQRVKELHLNLRDEESLPEWLDVVSSIFLNLEHLHLTSEGRMEGLEEIESSVSDRVQRLYVLYRLPNLRSIDGISVTRQERGLARPENPNGARVKREEWVESSLLDNAEGESECLEGDEESTVDTMRSVRPGNSVEVDLSGSTQSADASVDSEKDVDTRQSPALEGTTKLKLEELREESAPCMPLLSNDDGYHTGSSDLDRLEYASSTNTSAVACEWSAACGSLSIPKLMKARKPMIRLSFGRRNNNSNKTSPTKNEQEMSEEVIEKGIEVQASPSVRRPQTGRTMSQPTTPRSPVSSVDTSVASPVVSKSAPTTPKPEIEVSIRPRVSPMNVMSESMVTPLQDATQVPCAPKHSSLLHQRTLEKGASSPSKNIPPSKSLSSPFPMQFRVRAMEAESPSRELSVSTQLLGCETEGTGSEFLPPPPPPRERSCSSDFEMETIESPIRLTRTQSSPSTLTFGGRKSPVVRGSLPPPFPGARRVVTTPTKELRTKRSRQKKWLSVRSLSIMDDDDDEDYSSSDEENIVVED